METWVSPNFKDDKLANPTLDDLIDEFEDRMTGWFMEPAKKLLSNRKDYPASICLQMTYFEPIWAYMTGERSAGRSAEFFREGFVSVFWRNGPPKLLLARVAAALYEDARCGFFHDGMFRKRIYFGDQGKAVFITLPLRDGIPDADGEIESILLDPNRFHVNIAMHLKDYLATIRNPRNEEQRRSFQAIFMASQGRSRAIGLPNMGLEEGE